MNPRRSLTLLVSFAVTAIFLALALYPVDFAKLGRAFATADYRFCLAAAFLTFCGYVLRTARWQRLLGPAKRIPLARVFPILVVGFALNNLMPGRPGEFARAYALGRREDLSKTLAFATVVVERVSDGITLLAFLLLALAAFAPLGHDLPQIVEMMTAFGIALFGVALGGLLFLLLRESLALALFERLTRFLPRAVAIRLERILGSFIVGLHSLKSARDVAWIAFLSVAVWTAEGGSYFLTLSAFGAVPHALDRAVAAAFMMVVINLGIMIPAAPGGVGPFEAAGVFALSAFSLTETMAASVALAAHGVQYLLITGLGLVFIWRTGISLASTPGE